MPTPKAAATKAPVALPDVGSTSIQPGGLNGPALPAGTLHLVEGWEPLCGGERVRFVFPGWDTPGDRTCPACVQATLPRPRPATRSRARAS
jgi:hypothetical protein